MMYNFSGFVGFMIVVIFIYFNLSAWLNFGTKFTRHPFKKNQVMTGKSHMVYNVTMLIFAWSAILMVFI